MRFEADEREHVHADAVAETSSFLVKRRHLGSGFVVFVDDHGVDPEGQLEGVDEREGGDGARVQRGPVLVEPEA